MCFAACSITSRLAGLVNANHVIRTKRPADFDTHARTQTLTNVTDPVVAHWVWGNNGWANARNPDGERLFECGVIDFAGSGVVHMTGGLSALVGVTILGPRAGRFNIDGTSNFMPAQSAVLQVSDLR